MQRTEFELDPSSYYQSQYDKSYETIDFITTELPEDQFIKIHSIKCLVTHPATKLTLYYCEEPNWLDLIIIDVYPIYFESENILKSNGPISIQWDECTRFTLKKDHSEEEDLYKNNLESCRLEILWTLDTDNITFTWPCNIQHLDSFRHKIPTNLRPGRTITYMSLTPINQEDFSLENPSDYLQIQWKSPYCVSIKNNSEELGYLIKYSSSHYYTSIMEYTKDELLKEYNEKQEKKAKTINLLVDDTEPYKKTEFKNLAEKIIWIGYLKEYTNDFFIKALGE